MQAVKKVNVIKQSFINLFICQNDLLLFIMPLYAVLFFMVE